jgi:hypothetical protein
MNKPQGIPMPRLGARLADGEFAGIVFDPATNQDVALVDLGFSTRKVTHAQAAEYAASKGGSRPTREEARVLWANLDSRSKENRGYFWLETEAAGYEGYAWYQYFGDGTQYHCHKDGGRLARAVRRLPLQHFDHSDA